MFLRKPRNSLSVATNYNGSPSLSLCFQSQRGFLCAFLLVVIYTTPEYIFNTSLSAYLSRLQGQRSIRLSTSPFLESSATTMESQQAEINQTLSSFFSSKPTMTRPWSSRYGNPLTFNVAIMFLFYVLSVTLCLSSVSTCACVIFNPVGTFRTIANYLSYTLGLSLLLTFLSIPLIVVYFDIRASPEPQAMVQVGDEKLMLEKHREMSAPHEVVDTMPIQEEHSEGSATQDLEEATLTQEASYEELAPQEVAESNLTDEADCEVSAQYALLAQAADCERLRCAYRSPPIEAQATALLRLINVGAFTTNPAARDDGDSPPTPATGASQPSALEDHLKKHFVETEHAADRAGGVYEEKSALPKDMSDAAESRAHMLRINATNHIEKTASQNKAKTSVISSRGSRKIEKWMNQTNSADTDDADEDRADEAQVEDDDITVARRGPLSETRSISSDSEFQKALRVYMGKGAGYRGKQRRAGTSSSSSFQSSSGSALSAESEFQGSVREMLRFGKVGGKRKARSV